MRLHEALEQTATAMLRRIASHHGLSHGDNATRTELIERIGQRLLDAAYLEEQVHSLDAGERRVLLAAQVSRGELRGYLIDRTKPGATEALAERGLVYRLFATAGLLRGEVFVVPDEVLQLLPARPPAQPPPAGELPSAERRTSDPVFSLFALASALTRRGGHLEREVRSWSHEPGGWNWDARWTFLRHLAQANGLLIRQADGTLTTSPRLSRLLDHPAELTQRLWRSYLADRSWSELAQAGVEHGEDLADAVPLRQPVLDAVQQLPDNAWIGLDVFVEWLKQVRPTLVREQLNARGLVELESLDWLALEARLLRYCLLGPLYWLGMVAASADGSHVMRRTISGSTPRAEACTWQEDPAELATSADKTVPASSAATSTGRAAQLNPTSPESSLTVRSIQAGLASSEISSTHSSTQANPASSTSIISENTAPIIEARSDWTSTASSSQTRPEPPGSSSRNNPFHLSPTSAALGSAANSPEISPASSTLRSAVSAGEVSPAPSALRSAASAGEGTPPSSATNSSASPRQMVRPPTGSSATQNSAPVLLAPARGQLGTLLEAERYLVLRERGRLSRYQLVQAQVAGALSSGGSIGECRQLLIRLTQAELPNGIGTRITAWERRFGALAVRPAVLIEARSPRELDEAIADEQVRPFVRARLGPTAAEVPAADALELASRLREGGHLPQVDAALRLAGAPRSAYAGLVDEQVLEFLLVSLLAFQRARPERLAELEGSLALLDRLERQFPRERLAELRAAADRLAGELTTAVTAVRRQRRRPKRARRRL